MITFNDNGNLFWSTAVDNDSSTLIDNDLKFLIVGDDKLFVGDNKLEFCNTNGGNNFFLGDNLDVGDDGSIIDIVNDDDLLFNVGNCVNELLFFINNGGDDDNSLSFNSADSDDILILNLQ